VYLGLGTVLLGVVLGIETNNGGTTYELIIRMDLTDKCIVKQMKSCYWV